MSMFLAPTPLNDAAPITELNTTPLIDVLLVLLVMLIITIPLQTHAVKLDLPNGAPPPVTLDPIKNKLVVTEGGGLLFNGVSVSRSQLQVLLDAAGQARDEPELQLQPV